MSTPDSLGEDLRLGPFRDVDVTHDLALRLGFSDGDRHFDVTIAGPFVLTTPDGEMHTGEGDRAESAAIVLNRLRDIEAITASDGILTITAQDGSRLLVPPSDMYEMWIVRTDDGYFLASPMSGRGAPRRKVSD